LLTNAAPNFRPLFYKLNDYFKIKITDASKWEEDSIFVKGLYTNGTA